MPTIFTHAAVAVAGAYANPGKRVNRRLLFTFLFCALLPDVDGLGYLYFYIPFDHVLGHRGLTHSLPFAAAVSLALGFLLFYRCNHDSTAWWHYAGAFFLVFLSHIGLDALTRVDSGIAFLSPFDTTRYVSPWQPIVISPMNPGALLGPRGVRVLVSELLWVWIPTAVLVSAARIFLRRRGDNMFPPLRR